MSPESKRRGRHDVSCFRAKALEGVSNDGINENECMLVGFPFQAFFHSFLSIGQ